MLKKTAVAILFIFSLCLIVSAQQDKNARPDDVSRQYHYIGVAPQS